jgi:hypothetical protein
MHRSLICAAGLVAFAFAALVACGDDDTSATTPGGGTGSTSGGKDAGRDGKAFVEEADANTPAGPDARKPTDPLRVFVTKDTFTGDLDGTSGADTKCNDAATAAKISPKGKWVAWISVPGGQTIKDHVTDPAGTLPYQLLDGTSIAKKAADLLAEPGTPLHAINLSEAKEKVTGHVWTATKNLGTAATNACLAWTNAGADHKGNTGDSAGGTTWTELADAETCDSKNHLYCFEVP